MLAGRKICAIGFLLAAAALAQTADDLKSTFASVRYPPLPQQARIEGDVHLKLDSGDIKLVSGHPLLAPAAIANAKTLNARSSLDLTYHFVLADTTISTLTSTTVKRGNALERVFLRAFGFGTEKVVRAYQCEQGALPPNDVKAAEGVIEIWVYGRTFCLQTSTATVVAMR